MTRRAGLSFAAIFRIPSLVAALTLAGAIAALLFDGPIDLLWSALVATPLLAIGLALRWR